MKRKEFFTQIGIAGFGITAFGSLMSCKKTYSQKKLFFKISLAQWSFHRTFRGGINSPYEFAKMAHELGFEGLEYVNQLYPDVMKSNNKVKALKVFVKKNNALAAEYKIKNVLIMIDEEGDLSTSEKNKRITAIENHKLWINAANQMGCSAVRLNLYGESDPEKWITNSILSLTTLCDYAAGLNINVIVENHGRLTSNVPILMKVIKGTDRLNCGTLPDFGNFCISKEGYGSVFGGNCSEIYDPYKGVAEMMPKAFGVSAKSNDFDINGEETTLDFTRLMSSVKEAGYTGFVGVEYEGSRLSERDGIIATKKLLESVGSEL